MKMRYLNFKWIMALFILVTVSCEDDYVYKVPEAETSFRNDCIKRTVGPHVAGLNMYFTYAMALGVDEGTITSAQVEASFPGATGTYLEHRSFYTGSAGNDIGIQVADPSVTSGNVTSVTFTKDTCAATLRYYYTVPEAARGKSVEFTFSARASTGESVSYKMGPYVIGKAEMKLDIALSDNNICYISIADMMAYNAADAAAHAANIDLVYLYRSISGITFAHALAAPASNADFLPGITLPAGVTRSAKLLKVWGLRDQHLSRDRWGEFVDDIDFEELIIGDAPSYALNLKKENGIWVETTDGKYRAFLYVNAVNNSAKTMTISMKRYAL